jgi:hypothetical protein
MLPDPRGLDTGSADPLFGSGSIQIHAGSANTTFPLLRETDLPRRKRISTQPTPRARIRKAFSWVLGFFYGFIFLSSGVVLKGARPHFEGNSLFVYSSQGTSVKIWKRVNSRLYVESGQSAWKHGDWVHQRPHSQCGPSFQYNIYGLHCTGG